MAVVSSDQTQQHLCKLPCSYLSRKAKEKAAKNDHRVRKVIKSEFEQYLNTQNISPSSAYKLGKRTLTIIKSSSPQTSGSTSAMMIALDQFQKQISMTQTQDRKEATPLPKKDLFSNDFLKWVREGTTKSGNDLITHLKKEGFNPSLVYLITNRGRIHNFEGVEDIKIFNTTTVIEYLSGILSKSNNSAIVSIPLVKNVFHWIVIDTIKKKSKHSFIYLRDSFTGKAYKIPDYDFLKLLSCKVKELDKIEVVYINSLTDK